MAIPDLDLWRAANLLIERHGGDAALIAAQRADEMLVKGDMRVRLSGSFSLAATNELQRTQPAVKERRH